MKRFIKQLTVIIGITVLLGACEFEYEKPGEVFVPVEAITGVPTGGVAGYELILARSAQPDNATNKTIVWTVADDGGVNYTLNRNLFKADNAGTVTLRAVVKNGMSANEDYSEDFEIEIFSEEDYTPVRAIGGVPSECQVGKGLALYGAVNPVNALNKTIVWEVKDAGETGARISGGVLTAASAGNIVITAKITGGKSPGVDFVQDFIVKAIPLSVTSITAGFSPRCYTTGNIALSGTVNPADAGNKDIIWEIKSRGTTGAQINGSTLTVTAAGTVIITARIVDGVRPGTDYTWDFSIAVLPSADIRVYISANNANQAYYIKDGVQKRLPLPTGYAINSGSYTAGIVSADGSVYIAGGYFKTADRIYHPCYWKDGWLEFYDNDSVHSEVTGIIVDGGNVYMSGYYTNGSIDTPCYWKNGERVTLGMPEGASNGGTNSIAVDGSTVYAGGYYIDNASKQIACYWKITGGVQERVTLSEPPDYLRNMNVKGIAVLGSDVCAAGWYINSSSEYYACYWKNGVYENDVFSTDETGTQVFRFTSVGGSLYIGGEYYNYSYTTGGYWKWNGAGFSQVGTPGFNRVYGITVYEGVVYMFGTDTEYIYGGIDQYTDKNGTAQRLPPGTATGIAVVRE